MFLGKKKFLFLFLLLSFECIEAKTRVKVLQQVLERTDGQIKARAWVFLSYSDVHSDSRVWDVLGSISHLHEIFDSQVRQECQLNSDLIDELIYSSTIEEHGGQLHLVFDKAYSRITKHLQGSTLTLLVPPGHSIAATSSMITSLRYSAKRPPLEEVATTEIGSVGQHWLDAYDRNAITAEFIGNCVTHAGALGATYVAVVAGSVACGPACGAAAGITAYVVTYWTLETFMGWIKYFMGLTPAARLKEAYDFFHVDEDSTNTEIARAWRRVARKAHPDVKGGNQYEFQKAQFLLMLIKRHRAQAMQNYK